MNRVADFIHILKFFLLHICISFLCGNLMPNVVVDIGVMIKKTVEIIDFNVIFFV